MSNKQCLSDSQIINSQAINCLTFNLNEQNEQYETDFIIQSKFHLNQSNLMVDPDSHIISRKSIHNFSVPINRNSVDDQSSSFIQKEEENSIKTNQERCNQLIESSICIMMNSGLYQGHIEFSEAESNDKNQKGKHSSKFSANSQQRSQKQQLKTHQMVEVQEEKGRYIMRPLYMNSEVIVDLGATNKSIRDYYESQ